jgi:hypothetical protein
MTDRRMDETYEYKKVNVSLEPIPKVEAAANRWGMMGWRTIAVLPGDRSKGFADVLILERMIGKTRERGNEEDE